MTKNEAIIALCEQVCEEHDFLERSYTGLGYAIIPMRTALRHLIFYSSKKEMCVNIDIQARIFDNIGFKFKEGRREMYLRHQQT